MPVQVYVDGELLGRLERSGSPVLSLPARRRAAGEESPLHKMDPGSGCHSWHPPAVRRLARRLP
jgi:hypothetical protein